MSQTLRAHVDLPVDGMTCAACASRVERRLNGIEGVEASVNYASNVRRWTTTRRASSPTTSSRRSRKPATPPISRADAAAPVPDDRLGLRVVVTAVLAVPVIAYAMASGAAHHRARLDGAGLTCPPWSGAAGRSTGRRCAACGTAPRRWTR